ncbi:hypothetical protein LtaPh_0405900 [Leishmania tarentolae]|uniref:Ankyrin repeat protein n=1 Tax=Leishmania tarentolae TaxID=5689 RepID=A0A640K7M9_LEITA|nr:hypothetical protein LtaPh_0405900 [Leishmania tarentolae]
MSKLAHVCLVALAGYTVAGVVGTYFLVRFRRLHCVRQVQPWYCILHYVCYGGFLVYFMRAGSMRRCRESQDVGEQAASLWSASSPQQLHWIQPALQPLSASSLWQVCVLLGEVVLKAFLSPWAAAVSASPSPAAAESVVRPNDIYEPLLQVIAATAFFSSFSLLCNAQWRYAVTNTAEQHPGLWEAIVGVSTTTATAVSLVGAADEVNKGGTSILHGAGSDAATVASLPPLMSQGSLVTPRILVQQPLPTQRRRWAPAPSYVNGAHSGGDSTRGDLADSGISTCITIATPGAEDFCGGDDVSGTGRANQVKQHDTGGHEATAAATSIDNLLVGNKTPSRGRRKSWRRSVRSTQPQKRAPSPSHDDYEGIDDAGEELRNTTVPSSSLWSRLSRGSGRRLCPSSAWACKEGQEGTRGGGRASAAGGGHASREQHRHLERLRQRLLVAFWLSDTVVVLLTFLLFAPLAVARIAVAVAAASAWATAEASAAQESSGLGHGRRGGPRLPTATATAAALPCPTEGFVGVTGLLLLTAERILLSRWMRLTQQFLALVPAAMTAASVETSPAGMSSAAARQKQLRQRTPSCTYRRLGSSRWRRSLDLLHAQLPSRHLRVETARSAATRATAAAATDAAEASMMSVPCRFWPVLTVAVLLLTLQVLSGAAWVWAAAVLLTTGCAVVHLVDSVAGPLRWVTTEYRYLVCCTWWELFFSFSFAVPSLDCMSTQEQYMADSLPGTAPGSRGGLGLPAAVGREPLANHSSNIVMAFSSATVKSPFGSRLRRHSTAHRSARLMKANGCTGPLWMGRRLEASSAGTTTTATVLSEKAAHVVLDDDRKEAVLLGGGVSGSQDVTGGSAAETPMSPLQFWHRVATKVLQESDNATGAVPTTAELRRSSSRFFGAEDVNRIGVASTADASLLHQMPTVSPLAILSSAHGMEHLNSAPACFTRENLKGSMLLTLPAVARTRRRVEAAELEIQERLLTMNHAELQQEEQTMWAQHLSCSGEMTATSTSSNENEEQLYFSSLPPHSAVSDAREHAGSHDSGGILENPEEAQQQQQQSVTQDGWFLRALATVVPGFSAPRCSGEGDDAPSSSPSTTPGSISTANAPLHENSSLSTATAHAWMGEENGFARFLDCVRHDGDNTYALQSLLAVYGNTFGHRVDARGRGALHYAAMGGFVHGAIFLTRIGAELNVLDKDGYAPLHYAVLYRTKVHMQSRSTAESSTAATQGVQHVIEATALQAAYSAGSDASSGVEDCNSGGRNPQESAPTNSSTTGCLSTSRETSLRIRSDPLARKTPVKTLSFSSPPLFTPSSQRRQSPAGIGSATAGSTSSVLCGLNSTVIPTVIPAVTAVSAAAAAAAATAVVVPEEQCHGMVSALVRLGAQVDLPTAKGLTALHLAVMQESIGLVNTLLRAGANPLRGWELETLPHASMMSRAASCCEGSSTNTEVLVGGASKTAFPCCPLGQGNDTSASHSTQKRRTLSSENGNLRRVLSDASGSPATPTRRCEWVDVHLTNAGHPIPNDCCKSPLLLAVELDADLAVVSMLHHVAFQDTTAWVGDGLSKRVVADSPITERSHPAAPLGAPPGTAAIVETVSIAHDSPMSQAPDSPPWTPAPLTSAVEAAVATIPSNVDVNPPPFQLMSAVADTGVSFNATATATLADSPPAHMWWERCCLHGFNPVHIALALGNAQVTRTLLLRWSYAEAATHSPDVAAAPHKSVRDAEMLSRRARESNLNEPRMTTTAMPDVTARTLLDFSSGAVIGSHLDEWAVDQQQHQPVLAHITPSLAEETNGYSWPTSLSGSSAEEATAPTMALFLVPHIGPAAFWVQPLRLNLFHLAAVGDSTECLAYVLRWRGAPDYVPCALDDLFVNEQRAESAGQESATATEGAYWRRRQPRRSQAYQGESACDVSEPPELLVAASSSTELDALGTEEHAFPAPVSSRGSSTRTPWANHVMASGEGAATGEAAARLEKIVEQDGVSTSPSSLPAASATSGVAAGAVVALQRSPGRSLTNSSTTETREMALRCDSGSIASSAISSMLNHAWTSSRFSAQSNEVASTATAPASPPRERRLQRKKRGFVPALLTLLHANTRVDGVRRRVRKTVFGSPTLRRTSAPRRLTTRRQSLQRPRIDGVDEDGDGSNNSTMMAKTCYGSLAAAAALRTEMANYYAAMGYPPRRRIRSECCREKGAGDPSSRCSGSISNHANVQCPIAEALAAPQTRRRRAKKTERTRRLRQHRSRAFISAVAKLRHCTAGIPIDIAHLSAVEAAVDEACTQMVSTSARRALQQSLLIVTQHLQNQHRRTQLITELSCVAAAARETASAPDDGRTSAVKGDAESTTTPAVSAAIQVSTVSTGDVDGNRNVAIAGKSEFSIGSQGGSMGEGRARDAADHRCCCAFGTSLPCASPDSPSALCHDSSVHLGRGTATTTTHGSPPAEPDERARVSASEDKKPRRRGPHRQQGTLHLLRQLSAELNAFDTRGLTPLHYAIANQNASMVYLLCAYGATFVFASEETETHPMRHSAELIAAAATAERHTGSCDRDKVAASNTQLAASQEEPGSVAVTTDSMAPASSLPTAWTYARAQLSTPPIGRSTGALSSLGECAYAQLPPSTQQAIRQAANTGSAVHLLWMPTQEEREAERRQQQQQLFTLPVSEERNVACAKAQHSAPLLASHALLSSAAPAITVVRATAGGTESPPNNLLHSPVPPDTLLAAEEPLAKPTVMADDVRGSGGGENALSAQLQTHVLSQDMKTLQPRIAGKPGSSNNNGGSFATSWRWHPKRLPTSPDAGVSLDEAKDEPAVAVDVITGTPFKQDVGYEAPLQSNASSSSEPNTLVSMRTPTATTTVDAEDALLTGVKEVTQGVRKAAVPFSSSSTSSNAAAAAAAVEYRLLAPHDVFLMHVVRDPAKAEGILRAAMEGTALRYLFLASGETL